MRHLARVLTSAATLCATAWGQNYEPPAEGLVGWWRANGDARDEKGELHGELQGVTFARGARRQAFVFDDPDDRVVLDDVFALHLTESLTLQAWIQIEAFPTEAWGHVIFRGDEAPGRDPYGIATNPDGRVHFWVESAEQQERLSVAIPEGVPIHVAGTLDDATGRMTLYVNAHPVATTETMVRPLRQLDPALNAAVTIGNHSPSNYQHPFRGWIDEVVIHSRVLSFSEIQDAFEAGIGHPTDESLPQRVSKFLNAAELDRYAMREIVAAGSASAPWLLAGTSDSATATRAHRALRLLGAHVADQVVPALRRQATKHSVGILEATRTLAALAHHLTDPKSHRMRRRQLPKISENQDAVPALVHWCHFANQIERPATTDPRELTRQLDSNSGTARLRAVEALGKLGSKAGSFLSDLHLAMARDHPSDGDGSPWNLAANYTPMIHDAARVAIARIAPHDPEARGGLEFLVREADDPFERSRVLMSLAALRDPASIPVYVELTESEDPVLVAEAISAIGLQNELTAAALARLDQMTHDPRPAIAQRATQALASIRGR